jgi:hypothetical protein
LNVIDKPRKPVGEHFREGSAIDAALRSAVQDALRRHKQLGHSIVVWEGGKVVRLRPEQFEVEGPTDVQSVKADSAPSE